MKRIIITTILILISSIYITDAFAYTITDDSTGGDCSTIGIWDSGSKTCTLSSDVNEGITIGSSYVTLDGNGFSIIGTNPQDESNWDSRQNEVFGIFVETRTNVIIKNIQTSNFYHGIFFNSVVNSQIQDITSKDNRNIQIHLYDSHDNTISENTIPCGTGIAGIGTYFGDGNSILGNTVSDCSNAGINVIKENNVVVSNNIIDGQGTNYDPGVGLTVNQGSHYATITGNTVKNYHDGLLYTSGEDGLVKNNIIFDNENTGLKVSWGGNIVTDNIISNNGLGISLGSNGNTVYHNNLISNNLEGQGSNVNLIQSNELGGNYWSDYGPVCTDSNNDNFCDDPHPLIDVGSINDDHIWTVQDGWLTTINTPNDITLDATDALGITYDYSVSATHDGSSMSVACDVSSGSVFPIGITNVLCTANNGIKNTFLVTVNPPLSIIHPSSPCDDGCTHEGNNLDLKIFASGYVEFPIDGINSVSSVWKDPNGIVVYDKTLQVDSQGQFNNEFDNPMYVGDMRDSGLYTTTYQYDDVTLEYTWNYLTSVYVPEPEDTIPPVVSVPSTITVETTNSLYSKSVSFSVSSTDNIDGNLPVTCNPVSGSEFTVGTTSITCSATDLSGNIGTSTFNVIVIDASETDPEPTPDPESTPDSTINVDTNDDDYEQNDVIQISGKVTNPSDSLGTIINISVTAPNGNLVSLQQTTINSANSFSSEMVAGGSLMKSEGQYTVTAKYGNIGGPSDSTSFYYEGTVVTPTPQPDLDYEVKIVPASGSGAPGCEETSSGCYHPQTQSVQVGGVVVMENTDSAAHTFTSGTPGDGADGIFDTGLLMAGGSYEWSADEEGQIPYYCMVHPWMEGLILVGDDGGSYPIPEMDKTELLSLSTKKTQYHTGDTIVITGKVSTNNFDIPITLQVFLNGNVVDISQIQITSNESFSHTILAEGPLWKADGKYTIKATYGNDSKETNFVYRVINSEPTPNSDDEVTIIPASGSGAPGCEETSNGCYLPEVASIAFGGTIIMKNTDSAAHTFTAGTPGDGPTGEFDTGLLMKGGTYNWTANENGQVPYFCMVHPWMEGLILVGDGTLPPTPEPKGHIDLEVSAENRVYDINSVAVLNISIENNIKSQNVALDITDPRGTTVISRSVSLSPDDSISYEFKIDENAKAGNYKVTVTTSDGNRTEKDTTHFKVKSQFNSFKITSVEITDQKGNPSDLEAGEIGFIKVSADSNKSIATLVTVNIFDSELTSIGIGSVQTTLSSGGSEMILSFNIPNDAATGPAEIFVNAFSDWPSEGGIPLTSEVSTVEDIS